MCKLRSEKCQTRNLQAQTKFGPFFAKTSHHCTCGLHSNSRISLRTQVVDKRQNNPNPENTQKGNLETNFRTYSRESNDILKFERFLAYKLKRVCPGSRRTKNQLLIDKTVCADSWKRRTNLAVIWIDYQKAYDSVPHSCILEALKLHKIDENIERIVAESMKHWYTTLTCSGENLAEIEIRCGIFQGDALSRCLFCVAPNLLNSICVLNFAPLNY